MKIKKKGVPSGTVIDFGGGSCPSGYLLCDGQIYSIAQYPALYAAIGYTHGYGNNDGLTFHVPDRRGRMPRGSDNMGTGAAGRDPDAAARTAGNAGGATGNNAGSVQADAFQGFQVAAGAIGGGGVVYYGFNRIDNNIIGGTSGTNHCVVDFLTTAQGSSTRMKAFSNGSNGTPREASETRGQNFATIYAIKI